MSEVADPIDPVEVPVDNEGCGDAAADAASEAVAASHGEAAAPLEDEPPAVEADQGATPDEVIVADNALEEEHDIHSGQDAADTNPPDELDEIAQDVEQFPPAADEPEDADMEVVPDVTAPAGEDKAATPAPPAHTEDAPENTSAEKPSEIHKESGEQQPSEEVAAIVSRPDTAPQAQGNDLNAEQSPAPTAEDLPPKPATAPAACAAPPPLRGSLALPNRGLTGAFKTKSGRVLTPADMVKSCERLMCPSGAFDPLELQAYLASLPPRPKTTIGKEHITADELSDLVGRLCSPRKDYAAAAKVHRKPVKMKWSMDEKGLLKSDLIELPIKPDSERTEYLKELYARCVEGHAKTKAILAEKYLKPLYNPKIYEGADGKEKIKAVADKLYRGEKTKD